jgi:hypothetical protein
MAKIPVGATIAAAYRFAFTDFLKILGVVWIPWTITSVGGFFLLPRLIKIFAAMGKLDFAAALNQSWILVPWLLFGIFLYSVQIAATIELALQSPRKQLWHRFSVGKPVWRLIGAALLVLLVFIGSWIASILAGVVVGLILSLLVTVAKVYMKIILTVGFGLIAALAYAGILYVTVRLAFLLPPVVVAEEKISLRRAASLGRGNFWRLLGIFLAIFLPFWLLQRILLYALLPQGMLLATPPGASAAEKAAVMANVMTWATQLLGEVIDYWYIVYPLGLIWSVLYLGLIFGAQAFAYRAATAGLPPVTDN